jgi:ketosteroid isomerase-like protein
MSEQDNTRVAEKWIEALGAHDLAQLQGLRAPGYVVEHPAMPGPVGAEEEDEYLRRLTEAYPDWRWEDVQIIAQGDYIVINGIRRGTQSGPISGSFDEILPATGKELALRISTTLQLKEGKVVRSSVYYDRLTMMKELGQILSW